MMAARVVSLCRRSVLPTLRQKAGLSSSCRDCHHGDGGGRYRCEQLPAEGTSPPIRVISFGKPRTLPSGANCQIWIVAAISAPIAGPYPVESALQSGRASIIKAPDFQPADFAVRRQ